MADRVKIWEDTEYFLDENEWSIYADSPKWIEWFESHNSFRFEAGFAGSRGYTARKEKGKYWYAYKKVGGKLRKEYIGLSQDITVTRLSVVSYALEGEIKQPRKLHTPICNPETQSNEWQEKIEAIKQLIEKRKESDTGTRNWVECRRMIQELEGIIGGVENA